MRRYLIGAGWFVLLAGTWAVVVVLADAAIR